ncbi:MAG: nucleotidyltransferase family protein [Pseudomonadota bacterium]
MDDHTGPGSEPVLPPLPGRIKPVLLAAGASRRLGQPKQLVQWGGKALVARAVDAVLATSPHLAPVTVVTTSALRPAIARALAGQPTLLLDNPFAEREGMASSLRLAVAAARSAQADALMIMLSDQPLIDAGALRRLLNAWIEAPGRAVASAYGEVSGGVPAVFPPSMFAALAGLRGDVGARAVLRATSFTSVAMPEAALDIDRPEDLARLPATSARP